MPGSYTGTTHQSRHNGHGQRIPRSRFAIKMTGHPVGVPTHGKNSPWYLKGWRSKPQKPARMLERVA